MLAVFSRHTSLETFIASDEMLEEIVALGYLPNDQLAVAELLERVGALPNLRKVCCHVMPYYIMLYHVMSCHVISYHPKVHIWVETSTLRGSNSSPYHGR